MAQELRKGQFGHPETKQQVGRPKGSKNRITIAKLILEEAVIDRNSAKLDKALDGIIEDAVQGDNFCRKLVWDTIMTKGIHDAAKTTEKVEIKVGRFDTKEEPKDIEAEVTVVKDEEETQNEG